MPLLLISLRNYRFKKKVGERKKNTPSKVKEVKLFQSSPVWVWCIFFPSVSNPNRIPVFRRSESDNNQQPLSKSSESTMQQPSSVYTTSFNMESYDRVKSAWLILHYSCLLDEHDETFISMRESRHELVY